MNTPTKFPRRKYAKVRKHMLHEAKVARAMREDIVEPKKLELLNQAVDRLNTAFDQRDTSAFDVACENLDRQIQRVYPSKSPKMRENIEIIVVAIAIAMGFRTYFLQPFKIPTGSMMNTLYGITIQPDQTEPTFMDLPGLEIIKFLATGRSFREVRAKASGTVVMRKVDNNLYLDITSGDQRHRHRIYGEFSPTNAGLQIHMRRVGIERCDSVRPVAKGDLIWRSGVTTGDHILVNKMKYNFVRPQRGDIIVFSTDKIPGIPEDTYYIKRLVGLPDEQVDVSPEGQLLIGGAPATEPRVQRYYEPTNLVSSGRNLQLQERQYAAFGDNTRSSSDSRMWGSVPQESVMGPAFMVYWPFWKRFGLAR